MADEKAETPTDGSLLTGEEGNGGGGEPQDDPSTEAFSTEVVEEGWLKGIPKELAEDPSMKAIKDIPSLVKSHVHAQKMIGRDKVVIPGKEATEDDFKEFFQKVGLPENADKYEIGTGDRDDIDQDFLKDFKEAAYNANILPKQAEKLFNWYNEKMDTMIKSSQEQQENNFKEEIENLRKEWGEGFDKNVSVAKRAVKHFADEDVMKYLEESGLGNDTKLIKLFNKIGESMMSEDTFKAEATGDFGKTPDEARQEANEILGNMEHPYWKKGHPSHNDAVKRVNKLLNMAG